MAVLLAAPAWSGNETPKRELRSTWFTTHVNIDWPRTKGSSDQVIAKQKADMIDYIEGFERMNLNGACFQVRAQCDATYRSSYEPWSAVITGSRGVDPGWDPFQFCIDECHKRGLECYAWINPFRWSTGTDYKTPQDIEFKEKGWILSYGGYYVLNPALPEAREHILKVCREIITKYDIDGVLFDDYFYPNNIPENESAGDWAQYKASGTTMSIGDWRRENINIFVRAFQAMIEEEHPDMRFGISPAGVAGKANTSAGKFGVDPVPVAASDWQYGTIYSDPLAWLNDGSIDFISPQIYWQTYHSTAPYEPLCEWWTRMGDHFGRHFYSSQNVYFFENANNTTSWNEVAKQIELNRKYAASTAEKAPGTIYFSSKYFYGPALSGLGDHLLANVYQTKSLTPIVSWKKVPSFGAPEGLTLTGDVLTWKAIEAPRSNIRYTVYAIPAELTIDEAMEADGDGISNDYLLKVVYGTEFTVPENLLDDHWYAVCAMDGLGNEFAPATTGYGEGESAKVTLLSPAEGAGVAWTESFSWSAADGASYTVRIASDAAFSDIVYTSQRLSMASVVPDMTGFEPETKYYWNVTCAEPGKLRTISDTRSFTTPAYTNLPAARLLAPENGVEVEGDVRFSWTAVDGASSYTLEVAKDQAFTAMRYRAEAAEPALTVNPSLIGKGECYWRVTTTAPLSNPSVSEVRKFTIANLAVGAFEPGYVVVTDGANYPEKDGIKVENLWIRGNFGGLANMAFDNGGSTARSMVAAGDFVYVTRRSENAEGATCFLDKYDDLTGERISSIQLGDEARSAYYPDNTVVTDDAGNVIIANLTLNATTVPVRPVLVDLTDGSTSPLAEIRLKNLSAARVDHINITGDVTTGNYTVYFALASTNNLVRVSYTDGVETEVKITKFSSFYPSNCSTFGIAPFLTPISHDEVLANGGGTGLGVYNLATGKLTDSVDKCADNTSAGTTANGSTRFTMAGDIYTAYPATDHRNGYTFDIVRGKDATFASTRHIATVPAGALGSHDSGTSSTPLSAVTDPDGSTRLYVYSPGNGLAGYRLIDTQAGASDIAVAGDLTPTVDGLTVRFNKAVGSCTAYTVTGAAVAQSAWSSAVTLPAPGHYILVADGKAYRVAVR